MVCQLPPFPIGAVSQPCRGTGRADNDQEAVPSKSLKLVWRRVGSRVYMQLNRILQGRSIYHVNVPTQG